MTDTPEAQTEDEPQGPLAGQRLAEARRARDIPVRDVAKELHLDEPKVRALERNDFEALGAPVFAKGHLRKYAELVGVPVDDVLADYYSLNRAVGAPPIVGSPRKRQRDIRLGPWIKALLFVGIAAGAAYWWMNRDLSPPAVAGSASLAPFVSPESAGAPGATAEPAMESAAEEEDEVPASAAAAIPVPASATADEVDDEPATDPAPAGVPQVTMSMSFSGDCWTEVSDASGERLFFGLGSAGRNITVSGDAPLRVLFGDSNNVSIAVDGSDYPIPASARRGQTARLTINSR